MPASKLTGREGGSKLPHSRKQTGNEPRPARIKSTGVLPCHGTPNRISPFEIGEDGMTNGTLLSTVPHLARPNLFGGD